MSLLRYTSIWILLQNHVMRVWKTFQPYLSFSFVFQNDGFSRASFVSSHVVFFPQYQGLMEKQLYPRCRQGECKCVLVQTHPLLQPGHLLPVESILLLEIRFPGFKLLGLFPPHAPSHKHTGERKKKDITSVLSSLLALLTIRSKRAHTYTRESRVMRSQTSVRKEKKYCDGDARTQTCSSSARI